MFEDRRVAAPIRQEAHDQRSPAPASEQGFPATHPPFYQSGVFPEDALAVNFSNAKVVGASFAGSVRKLAVQVPGNETVLTVRVEDNKFEVQTGPSRVHTATAAQTAQLHALLASTRPGDLQYVMQL
jgi:hypothetical protein